ncbi:MAG: HAD-IIIA family hydrolase [Kiritimatiellae bacterium]|nr:HAD-IIIA family hydrolase [Kiritimatiellia bacterium]
MTLSIDERAARVRAIVFDVDGVLTAGGIIYGPHGEWKVFDVQDGHGFAMARRGGLKLALLSARSAEVVERRAKDLGAVALQGAHGKGEALEGLLKDLGVTGEETCYVGDDVVDLPAMRRVGFPVAVANAVAEVRQAACWTTARRGGEGAAREVIERILKAQGRWQELMKRYTEDER